MKKVIKALKLLSYLLFVIFLLVILSMLFGYEHKELLLGVIIAYVLLIQAIDYAKEVDKKRSHK